MTVSGLSKPAQDAGIAVRSRARLAALRHPPSVTPSARSVKATDAENVGSCVPRATGLPKGGGAPDTVVDGQQSPFGFALGADSIYWTAEDDVLKALRSGGAATRLVEELWYGTSLAADGQYLSWTDTSRIQRMPKK